MIHFSNQLEGDGVGMSCARNPLEQGWFASEPPADFAVFCWQSQREAANWSLKGPFPPVK
jgi:phage terminase large subunit-like protein